LLPLYLASASPRRRELLTALLIDFRVEAAQVDESRRIGESARDLAVRLAAAKAAAVAAGLKSRGIDALVLAADTVVAIDDAVLGKPEDADDALAMLRRLAGRRHDVITACRLVRTDDGRASAVALTSGVTFQPWDEARAAWYVATGEPFDKAGAYGIQGFGVFLCEGLAGSWSNVVGLPLEGLPRLFHDVGDDLFGRMERG
jgi:septum formation protein